MSARPLRSTPRYALTASLLAYSLCATTAGRAAPAPGPAGEAPPAAAAPGAPAGPAAAPSPTAAESPPSESQPAGDRPADEDDEDFEDDFDDEDDEPDEVDPSEPETKPAKAPSGPPRPGALPEIDTPPPPAWQHHLELGAGAIYVARPLTGDVPLATPRYDAGVGFGVDLRWEMLSFLRLHPYFLAVSHNLAIPPGALTTAADDSISPQISFPDTTAFTFSFGARLEPMLRLTERLKVWLIAGVGWGRLRIDSQAALDPTGGSVKEGEDGNLFIRDRAFSFVEFPLGMGVGVEVLPRWLTVNYDLTVNPAVGQSGDALEPVQAINNAGQTRDVAPLDAFDVSFVHSLNVALIL